MDDLLTILVAVFDARALWFDIGLALKVGVGTLDSIKQSGQFVNDGNKLCETLKTWLRTNAEPNWLTIVNALINPIVGRLDLAKKIEDEHCKPTEAEHEHRQVLCEVQKELQETKHQVEEMQDEIDKQKLIIEKLQADNDQLRQKLQQAQRKKNTTATY